MIEVLKIILTGALAAILTVALTWLKEIWTAKKATTYSSLQVAVTLEGFALLCSEAVFNFHLQETQRLRQESGALEIPSFPPFPSFPSDIDWKALPPKLMAEALTMQNMVEISSAKSISFMTSYAGDDEASCFALLQIARLGLRALGVATQLRNGAKLPPLPNADIERVALEKRVGEAQREIDELHRSDID